MPKSSITTLFKLKNMFEMMMMDGCIYAYILFFGK